jgi:hypothetical protein
MSELKYKFSYSTKNIQNLNGHVYNQSIIFWIEILFFGFENNDLEFKYQFLDQIIFLSLNIKIHIQIIF